VYEDKKILIVGAHPDDIEFGMGATLNKLDKKNVRIIVLSDTTNINGESIVEELNNSMKFYKIPFELRRDITNMNFINQEKEVKQILYDLKNDFKPDIIFSTSRRSYNPDHQIVGVSCLNVFQEQTVLFYEVIRGDYEHRPNFYIKVNEEDAEIKIRALKEYISQVQKKDYAKSEKIKALLEFRGSQCNTKFAEAFEVGRIIL